MEEILDTIREKGVSEVRSNLEKTLDDILEKRFLEGREEGREEGIEIGVLRTAQNLIDEGMSTAFIAKVTGLDEAVIEQMRKSVH